MNFRLAKRYRMHMVQGLLAGVLAVLALGCGDDDDAEGSELLSFYKDFNAAACAKAFECCTVDEANEQIIIDDHVGSASECTSKLNELATAFAALGTPEVERSANAGRVTLHMEGSKACLDGVRGMTCAQFSMLTEEQRNDPFALEPCRGMVVANVADGGACSDDNECTTGFCKNAGASGASDAPGGVCAVLPVLGEDCSASQSRCSAGNTCTINPNDFAKKICVARKADGEACFFHDDCLNGHCIEAGEAGAVDTCGVSVAVCDGV